LFPALTLGPFAAAASQIIYLPDQTVTLLLVVGGGRELAEVVTPDSQRLVDPHVGAIKRSHRRPESDAVGSQRIATNHEVCPELHHPVGHRQVRRTEAGHVFGVGEQVEGLVGQRNPRLEGALHIGLLVHFLVAVKLTRIVERVEEGVVRVVFVVHV